MGDGTVVSVSTEPGVPPFDQEMPLRQRLRDALPAAMKARDRAAVSVLRSALAAIDNAEAVDVPTPVHEHLAIEQTPVGLGAAEVGWRALSEEQVVDIVRGELTERQVATRDYDRSGQRDRAAELRAQAEVLSQLTQ